MMIYQPVAPLMLVAAAAVGLWVTPGVSQTARAAEEAPAAGERVNMLLLTGGPVHDALNIGNVVQAAMEKTGLFEITRVHEDLDALLAERIAPFDLVMFYWTLGEITEAQKRGLMNHVAGGKGFVTFHSGADSFRGDPDYRAFVGGFFVTHPAYRTYQVSITEQDSPITRGIDEFMITDEQYVLDFNPQVNVLANSLYRGRLMPVMWTRDWGKGRVFYSALGHDPRACEQEMFQKLLIRGALWAAGREIPE